MIGQRVWMDSVDFLLIDCSREMQTHFPLEEWLSIPPHPCGTLVEEAMGNHHLSLRMLRLVSAIIPNFLGEQLILSIS